MTYPRRHRSEYTAAVEPEPDATEDLIFISDSDYTPEWRYLIVSVHETAEILAECGPDYDYKF